MNDEIESPEGSVLKMMSVLYVSHRISSIDEVHAAMLKGGFDQSRPIFASYPAGADGQPSDAGLYLFQEVLAQQ